MLKLKLFKGEHVHRNVPKFRTKSKDSDLALIPPRSGAQQEEYNQNLDHVRQGAEKATLTIGGLRVNKPASATSKVKGRAKHYILEECLGAGNSAIVNKAINHETAETYAAKSYTIDKSSSRSYEACARSMLSEIAIPEKVRHVTSDIQRIRTTRLTITLKCHRLC